mmetsp:Transcript_8233/g.15497  ORF Transcript_8233/g.15497 Transcript_8233/m.15497 type:complete len:139 (-) Transcript_8233:1054-1470(-)
MRTGRTKVQAWRLYAYGQWLSEDDVQVLLRRRVCNESSSSAGSKGEPRGLQFMPSVLAKAADSPTFVSWIGVPSYGSLTSLRSTSKIPFPSLEATKALPETAHIAPKFWRFLYPWTSFVTKIKCLLELDPETLIVTSC